MPAVYGFADQQTAETLKRMAVGSPVDIDDDELDDVIGWVLFTPPSGIPALETETKETEIPSAECEAWALVEVGDVVHRRPVKNPDGEHYMIRVANMAPEAIAGGKFIRASRVVGGALLIDYAPC
ncbi:hypothetical protein [Neorhodopirellula pilleata]|uniref:Uncharacterized protein n=1 Tax=Neorhodopirellula pilleata TaxID=2714738 RepID=A0A5C5ZYQ8_9BACT|nr:hypothetical protein [Neorhodopirellula pilleata]TWT91384.1 hypothetical protein Pla100_52340 [Neorhodopirellula pilleata]TWT91433.1 hypothetical protein Pla100_52830 [Neorhodopirellula pilleata]